MNTPPFIYTPVSNGGTWLTNEQNVYRSYFEKAIRHYTGPLEVVVRDEAYLPLPPQRNGVVMFSPNAPLQPDFFSVHVLNYTPDLNSEIYRLGDLLIYACQEYEKEHAQ